jgi:hypothetical protein
MQVCDPVHWELEGRRVRTRSDPVYQLTDRKDSIVDGLNLQVPATI